MNNINVRCPKDNLLNKIMVVYAAPHKQKDPTINVKNPSDHNKQTDNFTLTPPLVMTSSSTLEKSIVMK